MTMSGTPSCAISTACACRSWCGAKRRRTPAVAAMRRSSARAAAGDPGQCAFVLPRHARRAERRRCIQLVLARLLHEQGNLDAVIDLELVEEAGDMALD